MIVAAEWAFLVFLVTAALTDLRALRIPNWLIAYGLAVAALRLALTPDLAAAHLGVAAATFGVTFVLFSFDLIGGGDAKLFPVAALWLGPNLTLDFLMLLVVAALLFTLALLAVRLGFAWLDQRAERWPLVLRRGVGVPLAVPTLPAAALLL